MNPKYDILEYFQNRWNEVHGKCALSASTVDEFTTWKMSVRKKLTELTGYDTMKKCDLNPLLLDQKDCGNYTRYHIEIQTEPGVLMPLYVLKPKMGQKPLVPVIAAHGHCGGGKFAVAGIHVNPQVSDAIRIFNYDYGRQLCEKGFIVFCPDARGFGERKDPMAPEGFVAQSCKELNNMALPLGQTVTGMWAWDLHRLIDYIETRDDCDGSKLCCAGLSGGGLQTLWASALDERIRYSVISGYFYGYKSSLLDLHCNCSCNYIPHLWEYVDMGDIAALIAPRPLFIETGDEDSLNGLEGMQNVLRPLETVKRAYHLFNSESKLKHSVFRGVHKWNGIGVADWIREQTKD